MSARGCNATAYVAAQNAFTNADIILILGSSLGKTDRDWFRIIADRINSSDVLLVSLAHGRRESRCYVPDAANAERDRLCHDAGYGIGALANMACTVMLAPRESFLPILHPADRRLAKTVRAIKGLTRK